MKNTLKKNLSLVILSLILALSVAIPFHNFTVHAQESIGSVVRQVGEGTSLPSYDSGHANQSYQAGASQLTSTIFFILDFFKFILGGIATLMIIISGTKLILSARQVSDAMSKEKETLRFASIGLILVIVADQVIRTVFYGEEGEVYRTGADLQGAAERGVGIAAGFTDILRVLIPVLAVLYMVVAGIRLIISRGDEDQYGKAKKMITWSVLGLILAGLAEVIVFRIVFPNQGSQISDPYEFNRLVVTMTNFAAGFVSTISVLMIIYAGYLYVMSGVSEQNDKAKKVLFGAIIGLIISMGAFALVNTFVKLEPLTDTPAAQEAPVPNT
ncbi:MAG: hypothetical protein ACRCZE_02795 [Candidatus Altimarinota bacterium]